MYQVDPEISLLDINMNWDHSCNVVVLQPEYYPNGTVIMTKQVSEYDGQVRPQVNNQFNSATCDDCWKKVPGTSALDFGTWSSIWDPELNCGDSCIQYTLEEHLIQGEVTPPRAIIGRSFRTGALAFNITDSVHIQSLNWSPFLLYYSQKNQFIGIGICCTEKWCNSGCLGLDSHMVLVSFMPYETGMEFTVLADIGDIIDPDTIRLGVEFSGMVQTSLKPQIFVFYQQTVVGYDVIVENHIIVSAMKAQQSPKIDVELVVWAGSYYM